MNTLVTKIKSAVSGIALFTLGCAMAGMGLVVVALLALFALASVGAALLASPFVAMAQTSQPPEEDDTREPTATTTATV